MDSSRDGNVLTAALRPCACTARKVALLTATCALLSGNDVNLRQLSPKGTSGDEPLVVTDDWQRLPILLVPRIRR